VQWAVCDSDHRLPTLKRGKLLWDIRTARVIEDTCGRRGKAISWAVTAFKEFHEYTATL
jgi:hypothetical protein